MHAMILECVHILRQALVLIYERGYISSRKLVLAADICDERVDGAAGLVEAERKSEWRKLGSDVRAWVL